MPVSLNAFSFCSPLKVSTNTSVKSNFLMDELAGLFVSSEGFHRGQDLVSPPRVKHPLRISLQKARASDWPSLVFTSGVRRSTFIAAAAVKQNKICPNRKN